MSPSIIRSVKGQISKVLLLERAESLERNVQDLKDFSEEQ